MKPYLAFVAGVLWVVAIIWAHGGSFEQGKALGAMVFMGPVLGFMFFAAVKVSDIK